MEYRIIRHDQSNDDYVEHGILKDTARKAYNYATNRGGRLGRAAGWVKEQHDYLARANIGGKWRYAYTPEQVKAMVNWGKGRIKKVGEVVSGRYAADIDKRLKSGQNKMNTAHKMLQTARNEAGRGAKSASQQTRKNSRNLYRSGQEEYEEALSSKNRHGLAYQVSKLSGSLISAGKSAVRNTLEVARGAKSFGETKLSEAREYAKKGRDILNEYYEEAKTQAEEFKSDPGRYTKDKAMGVRKAAGEAAGRALTKVGLQDEYDAAKRKAGEIAGSVKTKATDIRDKAKGIAEDPADWAKTKAERAGERISNSKVGDAWDYVKPGGTLDQKAGKAVKNVASAAANAPSTIKGAFNKAKGSVSTKMKGAWDFANDAYDDAVRLAKGGVQYMTNADYRDLADQRDDVESDMKATQREINKAKESGDTEMQLAMQELLFAQQAAYDQIDGTMSDYEERKR